MSLLEKPEAVLEHLHKALAELGEAHKAAGESEGDRTDLIGPTRDMLFGLSSALEALVRMVEEGQEAGVLREGLRQIIESDYPSDAGSAETWAQEILDQPESVQWWNDEQKGSK